jgi:hypothetical protein
LAVSTPNLNLSESRLSQASNISATPSNLSKNSDIYHNISNNRPTGQVKPADTKKGLGEIVPNKSESDEDYSTKYEFT